VDIDRVQPLQDRHATLCPLIATLDHHEGAAATDPFRIGLGLLRGDAQVCERLAQVGSLIFGVPRNRCGVGCRARGAIKGHMDIAARKAVRDQLLHDMLRVSERVI
jgi:hypothetical protein